MSVPLLLTREDAIAIISINDAPYNRMSLELMDQLEVLVDEIAGDDTIRAVVITGEGTDNFSVGMNLKQLPEGIKLKGRRWQRSEGRITSSCENGFPRAGATDSGHAVRVGGVPATTRA